MALITICSIDLLLPGNTEVGDFNSLIVVDHREACSFKGQHYLYAAALKVSGLLSASSHNKVFGEHDHSLHAVKERHPE